MTGKKGLEPKKKIEKIATKFGKTLRTERLEELEKQEKAKLEMRKKNIRGRILELEKKANQENGVTEKKWEHQGRLTYNF